jgi:DNA-binding CsgD family transcriptional regulator/tetratricopeptide (TPR) repeat protein
VPDAVGRSLLARDLVGRDAELHALRRAWSEGGTTYVVTSPAGVGKSRLVRELAAWAAGQSGVVLTGRSSPTGQETPLRPWREALLTAARRGQEPGPELEAFRPSLARVVPEWGDPGDDTSALVLGEAVLRLLSSWSSAARPTLLVLEDLQWADAESLAVLEYVVDNLSGAPLLVVGTIRDGEPGSGRDLVTNLVGRRAAQEIRLEPLDDEGVLAVARSCLDGEDPPAASVAALVERCDGVPFLVEELVATAVWEGWATVHQGVPGSVAASVATRLDALEPDGRRLLTMAALLGRSFDWSLAANAAGVPGLEAPERLRQAVQAQLVDVEGAGFRFHHALTRDAVLATATPADLVSLAGRALDELLARGAPPPDQLALAAQLADAAVRPDQAAALRLAAAERALAEGSLASAEPLAARARESSDAATRLRAGVVLLRALAHAGQTARAVELGRELLATSTDEATRAEVHLVLGAADLAAGRWDDAEAHASDAKALTRGDRARTARADALAAHAAMGRIEPDVAATLARSALDGARDTEQPEVQCEALEVIGRIERGRDLAAAEAAFTEALDVATRAGLRVWRARAMQELGTVDMFGDLSPHRLDAAQRLAVEAGALAMAAVVDLQLGALYEERGELGPALAHAERCEEASRRWRLSTLPMSLAVQAFCYSQLADREPMVAAIEAAVATGDDALHIEARHHGNVWTTFHIVTGDLRAAAAACDRGMDVIRAHPGGTHTFPGVWALLHTIFEDGGEHARAEVAALPVDTPISRRALRAAEAVAAGQAGEREVAERRMAQLHHELRGEGLAYRRAFLGHLVAPVAHADGWGDPAGWLRESLAFFESSGHDALAARCRALLKDIGAPVPRRSRDGASVVPPALAAFGITRREADVLALVATGATNREIAERLFISQRTVDKHVERLLQKSAMARADLAGLAREADLLGP